MQAPSDKRGEDAAAIEEACHRLRRLFINVVPWGERGAGTNNPKTEFRSALALVECFVNDSALDGHPLAGIVRKAAIPVLRRARPPIGRHGRHADLNSPRDRVIAETVDTICKQYGLSQEQASSVVSEALKSLVHEHRRTFRRLIKTRGADQAWIDECLGNFVDKLVLSEDRVEAIAKKYRTVRE
jgi:hypothetical protein